LARPSSNITSDNYDLKAITIRPFMVYGPGEYPSKYRSAIINFIHSALKGEHITVHGGANELGVTFPIS